MTLPSRYGPRDHQVMRWRGPNTEVIEVIRVRGKDNVTRQLYRLRRHGYWVADCGTLEELAQYVDLGQLEEDHSR